MGTLDGKGALVTGGSRGIGRAVAVRADQGSLDDLGLLAEQVDEHTDGLDILVINAAGGLPGPIVDVTKDSYDQFMAAHVRGPFFIIQHAGRTLRDGGRIIAISPLNTRLHPPGGALYTGAKAALENFTTVAAIEFGGRGITANVVAFLAGPDSGCVSGQNVHADGGLLP